MIFPVYLEPSLDRWGQPSCQGRHGLAQGQAAVGAGLGSLPSYMESSGTDLDS